MTLHVLEGGADVEIEGRNTTLTPDRVEILGGGFVKLIFKSQYEQRVYPREKIQVMNTHTGDLEDKEWW